MRRQDSKASGGQVRTEQHKAESLQRQDRMVRGAETIQKWGQDEETVEIYLQGSVGHKQNNNW